MFGLLKNKLKAFVDGIVKREEAKPAEAKPVEAVKPVEIKPFEKQAEVKPVEVKPAFHAEPKPVTAKPSPKSVEDEIFEEAQREAAREIEKAERVEQVKPKQEFKPELKPEPKREEFKREESKPIQLKPEPKPVFKPQPSQQPKPQPVQQPQTKPEFKPQPEFKPKPVQFKPEPKKIEAIPVQTKEELPKEEKAPKEQKESKPYFEVKQKEEEKRDLAPKLGLFKRLKSVFSSDVEIAESEVTPMLGELEMALLESDVSYDTTQFLVADLKRRLVGKRVPKNSLGEAVNGEVRAALLDLFPIPKSTFEESIRRKKAAGEPLIVLFLGPNGMGKTTTVAKIARWLGEHHYSCVLAAGDSFRAAAIEQLEHHGNKLGVTVVKHNYGADPTAVAFDAVAHARAKHLDVVLVDTAGRQETNVNLVKEMEKMSRVLKPDLRVFVGEAVAGHALVDQLKKFKETAGVDAIVLTKLDCDAKGGSAFSAAFEAKLPILFVGVGQEYDDLREFDAAWLVNNVLAS